jgi:hypothetical protein
MNLRDAARRARQRQQSDPVRDRETELNQHRVLSFFEWCWLNGFSPSTGRRILKSGKGPTITQLSARRIGVTVAHNAAWQETLARPSGDAT